MDIVVIASRPTQASYRFRVEPFLAHLAARGMRCRVVFWPKGFWRRVMVWPELAGADLVWVLRRLLSPLEVSILRRVARRLVYDFDDAVFLRDDGRASVRRWSRFVRLLRAADLVLCGNCYLADHAARFCRRAVVMPTVVDTRRFTPADAGPSANVSHPGCRHESTGALWQQLPRGTGTGRILNGAGDEVSARARLAGDRPLEVVWTGSRSTNRYLASLLPVFGQLRDRVRLTVISDSLDGLQDAGLWKADLRFVRWSPDTEVRTLQQADVGVMPLPDDPWTRGKCGLKLLQYMAVGLAAVASPVGVNGQILQHEQTGLLAGSLEEWSAALQRLAADESLRRRLGAAARQHVVQHYSVETYAPRLARLFESIVADSTGRMVNLFSPSRTSDGVQDDRDERGFVTTPKTLPRSSENRAA